MEPPFDRGEIDRASLDATERLRARLAAGRPTASAPPPQRSVLPWVIAGSLFVFTAGMIANPWFERSVRGRLPFGKADTVATAPVAVPVAAAPVAPPAAVEPAGERLARTEAKIETSSELLARDAERIDRLTSEVAALSARLEAETGRSEAASTTAIAAADRAQGMIAVLLARQAIEAGRRLNGIEPVLRQAFAVRYPQAVAAVAALGAAPVTLASLRRDFAAVVPATPGAGLDWWQSLTQAVRNVVSRPGDAPRAPREAAAAALARGDVAAAASQLRRLPEPRPAAVTNWLASAERWQAGMAALTTLETAAIMPPPPMPVSNAASSPPAAVTTAAR
jgi:hypothetical protein